MFSITLFCPEVSGFLFYFFYSCFRLVVSDSYSILGQVYSRVVNILLLNDDDCGSSRDKTRNVSACGICILTVRLFSLSCESLCIIHEATSCLCEEYVPKYNQNRSEHGEMMSWKLKLHIYGSWALVLWCMFFKSLWHLTSTEIKNKECI